jgi:protein-S-isoprenylcysteine O-methyltransferase Ste14
VNPFRFAMRHVPVPWVFVVAYLCGYAVERVWRTLPIFDAHPWLNFLGCGLFLIGLAVAGWGWLTFFRARTTRVPGEVSSRLVTWGPYRFSRNPMYVGLSLLDLGEAGLLRQAWPVLFLPFVVAYVNWVVIPVEERMLGEVFGDAYEHYRRRVRRWM